MESKDPLHRRILQSAGLERPIKDLGMQGGMWNNPAFQGFLWAMASNTSFVAVMILNKVFRDALPVLWLVWGRCFFALILVVPFLRWRNLIVLWPVQGVRGVMIMGAMWCSYTAYRHLPSHFAALIGASSTLFVMIFARIFLHEFIDKKRIVALLIGCLGVIILLSDSVNASWSKYVIWSVLGNVFAALVSVLSRWLSLRSVHPQSSMMYGIVIPLMGFSSALYIDEEWNRVVLTPRQWGVLVLLGAIGACIQYTLLRAYQVSKASFVAPLEYTRLCLMIPAGYVFLGEVPTKWAYVGGILIVGISFCFLKWESEKT